MTAYQRPINLSVVCPAHNEQDNLRPLIGELAGVLDRLDLEYEILVVDDGSTDDTPGLLRALMVEHLRLRSIRMLNTPPGRGHGQSAAFHAGFRASRGDLIAVMDADCQNDPADIPAMLALMRSSGADLVQGDRSAGRRDNIIRKFGSLVGRIFRRTLLGDTIRDTGCSLRIMRREVALSIPLEFRGMHRFIPVTARHLDFTVVEMTVNHRPRKCGQTKYGLGIWSRAIPGLLDCLAVRWMSRRRRPVHFVHHEPQPEDRPAGIGPHASIPKSLAASPKPQDSQLTSGSRL
jgi:glycosyltransferase involved in cell wall biosynthesis